MRSSIAMGGSSTAPVRWVIALPSAQSSTSRIAGELRYRAIVDELQGMPHCSEAGEEKVYSRPRENQRKQIAPHLGLERKRSSKLKFRHHCCARFIFVGCVGLWRQLFHRVGVPSQAVERFTPRSPSRIQISHRPIGMNAVSNQVANTARLKHPPAPSRRGRYRVTSKQRVPAIKPGLNGLYEKEIGDRKNRNRGQQRYRQWSKP